MGHTYGSVWSKQTWTFLFCVYLPSAWFTEFEGSKWRRISPFAWWYVTIEVEAPTPCAWTHTSYGKLVLKPTINLLNGKFLCIEWSVYLRYVIHSPFFHRLFLTFMCILIEVLYKPSSFSDIKCWLSFIWRCFAHNVICSFIG